LCETSAGAHLANGVKGTRAGLFYWREGNDEVDFVLTEGRKMSAIEVRTGRQGEPTTGLEAFATAFRPTKNLIVGTGGIPLEDFLSSPIDRWRA
jgi:predicted AAA+ superfamily ATPase